MDELNSFSDLALAKFLQTLPELGRYILTFQDLSDELDENTDTKVGVFILKPTNEIVFVPVVGKNDTVYPVDSIFFTSSKKFFPLTRKTISQIFTGESNLGDQTKIPETVNTNPSVYELVQPPRSGKFVYGSSSRVVEFLAQLPRKTQAAFQEKIAAEKSVYDSLDAMFGVKALFDVLSAKPGSAAEMTNAEKPVSVATIKDDALNLSQVQISNILNDGYHLMGQQPTYRVAVNSIDYDLDGTFKQVSNLDGNKDFEISMVSGETREAFIPNMKDMNNLSLAMFTDGSYAISKSFIAVGQELDRRSVLERLFKYNPPVLLRELYADDTFTIMLADGSFVGPFKALSVTLSSLGSDVKAMNLSTGKIEFINAYRNFKGAYEKMNSHLYIPANSVVIRLGEDVTMDLECSTTAAHQKHEFSQVGLLGDQLNLAFDGIEFSVNGMPVGAEPAMMSRLVVDEGIDPNVATKFMKEVKASKQAKIYLSKRAYSTDVNPATTPQYGAVPSDDSRSVGMNGAFMSPIKDSLALNDAQSTEATIISQLLQTPDMTEEIGEYLPDINEAIDRLGRILFMSRIHMERLSDVNDADSVFAFLASLRSVYQNLGMTYIKLQSMTASSQVLEDEDKEPGVF